MPATALVDAPTAALALVKLAAALRIPWGLGAETVAVRRGRGSEEFGPLDTMPQHQQATDPLSSRQIPQPRHDATLDKTLPAWGCSQTIARLGLKPLPALADAGLRR